MSPLLSLPIELRRMIYEYVIPHDLEIQLETVETTCTDSNGRIRRDARCYRYADWLYDEEVELQMRATLALFKLDRQTSPEAMEIFFGNNIFRFQPVDGRSAWGSPVLRWTLPNAFAAFARRVIIDIPGSTWEDEDEFKACKQGLEVMARVLSGQD